MIYLTIGTIWALLAILAGLIMGRIQKNRILKPDPVIEENDEMFIEITEKYGFIPVYLLSVIMNIFIWPIFMPMNVYLLYRDVKRLG